MFVKVCSKEVLSNSLKVLGSKCCTQFRQHTCVNVSELASTKSWSLLLQSISKLLIEVIASFARTQTFLWSENLPVTMADARRDIYDSLGLRELELWLGQVSNVRVLWVEVLGDKSDLICLG